MHTICTTRPCVVDRTRRRIWRACMCNKDTDVCMMRGSGKPSVDLWCHGDAPSLEHCLRTWISLAIEILGWGGWCRMQRICSRIFPGIAI